MTWSHTGGTATIGSIGTIDEVTVVGSITDTVDTQPPPSVISTLNSRAASTLALGAVFQGTGEDVSKYGRVGVSIVSDNPTSGTLFMQVSRDNVTYGGPSRAFADTRFSQPHMWNIVEQYFRIRYVNDGPVDALNLAIQVQYSNNANILLGHQLNEVLIDEIEGIVVRAVSVGKGTDGIYHNVDVDKNPRLQIFSREANNILEQLLAEARETNADLKHISGDVLIDTEGDL